MMFHDRPFLMRQGNTCAASRQVTVWIFVLRAGNQSMGDAFNDTSDT